MLAKAETVLVSEVGDEAVLLDLRSGSYFALNPVAACAWQWLCRTGSLDATRTEVAKIFDVSLDRLDADLDDLVAELRRLELLVEVP